MTRFLLAFFCALFVGSIGAFFLFVPPVVIVAVSIVMVALLVSAFMLTYWLAVSPGRA